VEVHHEAPGACEEERFLSCYFPASFFGLVSCFSVVSFVCLSPLVSPCTILTYSCGSCDSLRCEAFFCFFCSISSSCYGILFSLLFFLSFHVFFLRVFSASKVKAFVSATLVFDLDFAHISVFLFCFSEVGF
jgi:hypothetical protein